MSNKEKETTPGRRLLIIAAFILVWILGTACVIYWTGWLSAGHRERQGLSHVHGAHVMPVASNRALQVSVMAMSGFVRQAVARDASLSGEAG